MKIHKSIKQMPWPEPWHGGELKNFVVTFSWPVIDHEKILVATFVRNRDKQTWTQGPDFRLVCSKKNNTAAILTQARPKGRRITLDAMLREFGTSAICCYPEISEKDEIALAKWLWRRGTNNHLMPELANWVEQAQEAEALAERDARGELRNEDVDLCPEELPAGLVEYIRRQVLPTDRVLIYKKGNVRGTCFACGKKVRAVYERFRQNSIVRCPHCGRKVTCFLEGSDRFKCDYVEDIATIQKGTDGKTLFVRQWHLCRDMSAQWEDIPGQLDEVVRYAVRGKRAAKWQKEAKESYYMKSWRFALKHWERVNSVSAVYDGQYFFYLPENWKEELAGTSMQYCDLGGYAVKAERDGRDRNTIRFLMDWGRYPAVEKFWKAGYTGLIYEKVRGLNKQEQHAILWNRETMQKAIRFPFRLLKNMDPEKWSMQDMIRTATAWEWHLEGKLRENEVMELVGIPCDLDDIENALGHASVRKIAGYIKQIVTEEQKKREAEDKRCYNHYPFQTPHTYRDYLRECVELQLDLDDSTVLFPHDLEAAHQRTMAQVKYRHTKEQQKCFQEKMEKQTKLEWKNDAFMIRLPKEAEELTAEGATLHHCVGGYVPQVVNGSTVILFIRRIEEPDKPFYTLEWRNGRVQQCRTLHNKDYQKDSEVKAFVDAWVAHITGKGKKKRKNADAA